MFTVGRGDPRCIGHHISLDCDKIAIHDGERLLVRAHTLGQSSFSGVTGAAINFQGDARPISF